MTTISGDATGAPAVFVERLDRVALLTLSDPRRRNAMSAALSRRLTTVLDEIADDRGVHAVVITGDREPAPAFCAGGDLDELAAAAQGGADALYGIYAGFLAVAQHPLPVIAAVDGPAVGAGINLALAADIRIAGETARFDPGFLRLGLHPGGGMTWMAQRLIGAQATTAMLLAGETLDATRAVELGLALKIASGANGPDGRSAAVSEALRMAAVSARAPRELVLATKASVKATAAAATHTEAVDIELIPQLASLRSTDFHHRVTALRNRTPD